MNQLWSFQFANSECESSENFNEPNDAESFFSLITFHHFNDINFNANAFYDDDDKVLQPISMISDELLLWRGKI